MHLQLHRASAALAATCPAGWPPCHCPCRHHGCRALPQLREHDGRALDHGCPRAREACHRSSIHEPMVCRPGHLHDVSRHQWILPTPPCLACTRQGASVPGHLADLTQCADGCCAGGNDRRGVGTPDGANVGQAAGEGGKEREGASEEGRRRLAGTALPRTSLACLPQARPCTHACPAYPHAVLT